MPRAWREKVDYLRHMPLASPPLDYTYLAGSHAVGVAALDRREFPPEPDVAGLMEAALAGGAELAQLVVPEAVSHSVSASNPDLGTKLAAAFNDYLLERWVVDERLRYALVVFPGDAQAAATEIRRHGDDSRISSVWVPAAPQGYGDRSLYPIYEAAIEHGLPVIAHPSPGGSMATPEMILEGRANGPTAAWSGISSLIARGTFERYPELRFVFLESGFTWLDALVRRLDAAWRTNRARLPLLEREPGEVVRAHIRISTHPLDDDRDAAELCRTIQESASLADVLVYSSNHPRGPSDAATAFAGLPEPTRRKILAENAQAALRL